MKGTIELVAPDGTVVATSTHRGFFPMGPGSKYYKGSERPQIIVGRKIIYSRRTGEYKGEGINILQQ